MSRLFTVRAKRSEPIERAKRLSAVFASGIEGRWGRIYGWRSLPHTRGTFGLELPNHRPHNVSYVIRGRQLCQRAFQPFDALRQLVRLILGRKKLLHDLVLRAPSRTERRPHIVVNSD